MLGITKPKNVSIEGIVFPACQCGKPWKEHGDCGGYKPSKPIIDHGTVFFQSTDHIANVLYKLERAIKRLRLLKLGIK